MNEVAEALLARVHAARADLAAAVSAGDPYEVAVAEDELDDAVRIAQRHGLKFKVTGTDEG
ncbi:hypothetical protein ACIBL8_25535 [Streptomyces sp. NPDC050523]|uniref:hypothetical protein n=1 Tax=Streptomyces sp. NPDC050523 TaxID=3365622 RepID=UPI003793BAA5